MPDGKIIDIDNPEVLAHYDFLEKIGIIDELDRLHVRLRQSSEVIQEAASLFSEHTVDSLMDHLVSFLMDKFIPSHLIFVLKDRNHMASPSIVCFENLKQVSSPLKIENFEPFYNFFSARPKSISFPKFRSELGNTDIADSLSPLTPEYLFPLRGIDGIFGFLVFGRKIVDHDYSSIEVEYIEDLVTFSSVSLQNIINYTDAITDFKTGLYNHSFFIRRMGEELINAKRYKKELTLLLIDIDYFKKLNDTYGHLAGDEVLIRIADVLRHAVRAGDIVSRFGGEEFSVLLVQTVETSSLITAERIRTTVEETSVEYLGNRLNVTVSVGIRNIGKKDNSTVETIIHQADQALYKAKDEGRNRICVYNDRAE